MTSNKYDDLAVLPVCDDPVDVLVEHDDFLIIVKPSGLLSVPGRHPQNWDCLISRLAGKYPSVSAVHRLDYDTSGIMVVALNKTAHAVIARQFQERQVNKMYTAVVTGELAEQEGTINLPIAPDKLNRPKCKICHDEGKEAITRYHVESYDEASNSSRVLLFPETGRSHQLRLHMQALGHPMLGCTFYAPDAVKAQSSRLLLHATSLKFSYPSIGNEVTNVSLCPF